MRSKGDRIKKRGGPEEGAKVTFSYINKVLLGGIGLPISEVKRMSLSQVIDAIDGYNDRERDRTKVIQMVQWEATRWQTFILWNLHASKKYKIDDVRKLMVFDWEKMQEPPTKEEWEQINSKYPDTPRNGNR